MKKRIAIFFLVIALVFSATGCFEKTTSESLLKDAAKKLEDAESFEMEAKLNVDIEIEIETMSVGILAEAEASGEITDGAAHMKGELSYSAMSEKDQIEFEAYMVEKKDEITAYVDTGEGWSQSGINEDDEDFDDAKKLLDGLKLYKLVEQLVDYADDLELAKKTEKVGKKNAYVLEGKVSGEFITDYLKSLDIEGIQEDIDEALEQGDVDLKDYEVEIKLLIDKKTKLPLVLEIDFSGIVDKVVEQLMGVTMPMSDPDDEDAEVDDENEEEVTGASTNVKACVLEIEFTSFNSVKEIKVPKDVIKEAEEEAIEEHNEAVESVYEEIFEEEMP